MGRMNRKWRSFIWLVPSLRFSPLSPLFFFFLFLPLRSGERRWRTHGEYYSAAPPSFFSFLFPPCPVHVPRKSFLSKKLKKRFHREKFDRTRSNSLSLPPLFSFFFFLLSASSLGLPPLSRSVKRGELQECRTSSVLLFPSLFFLSPPVDGSPWAYLLSYVKNYTVKGRDKHRPRFFLYLFLPFFPLFSFFPRLNHLIDSSSIRKVMVSKERVGVPFLILFPSLFFSFPRHGRLFSFNEYRRIRKVPFSSLSSFFLPSALLPLLFQTFAFWSAEKHFYEESLLLYSFPLVLSSPSLSRCNTRLSQLRRRKTGMWGRKKPLFYLRQSAFLFFFLFFFFLAQSPSQLQSPSFK